MPVHSKSPTTATRRARRKQLEEPAAESTEELWVPAGNLTELRTATSAGTTRKREDHAAPTYAILEQTV